MSRDAHELSGGELTVDPTENVKALVALENRRQDDLRNLNDRRVDAELRVVSVRVESLEKLAAITATYEEKLSNAEAKRIDAIRAVDVNAVAVASQKQQDQATVLANQVVASADALRGLVATTATAAAQASQQITAALSDRITQLEKTSYEGAGKGTGAKNLWGIMVAATVLLFGFITTAIAVIAFILSRR